MPGGYYPPSGFHFLVEFGLPGVKDNDNRFQEVSGIGYNITYDSISEMGENAYQVHVPKTTEYENLVLKRGYLKDTAIRLWFRQAIETFYFSPTTVLVTLLNEESEPMKNWIFHNVLPLKWSVNGFNAMNSEAVIETIELKYQFFQEL